MYEDPLCSVVLFSRVQTASLRGRNCAAIISLAEYFPSRISAALKPASLTSSAVNLGVTALLAPVRQSKSWAWTNLTPVKTQPVEAVEVQADSPISGPV